MENYITEAFKRINLQQIREFIMTGGDADVDRRNYSERLKQYSAPVIDRLKNIYSDETELDKAFCEFNGAVGEYESVFTEIGMNIGAKLLFQLLFYED